MPAVAAWEPVDPASGQRPHRGVLPPALRVRGLGSCEANAAACHLLEQISAELGLSTRTPLRCTVARDPATTNPVLLPCETGTPASVGLRWRTGFQRVTCNLENVLRALEKPIHVGRSSAAKVPVEIARHPATGSPGLMLRLDQLSLHGAIKRGARTLAAAQKEAARANARLAKLEASGALEPDRPATDPRSLEPPAPS